MTKKAGCVSSFQMFSILFLCRIISLFTFMLPSTVYLPSGDRILATLPVAIVETVFALIALYIINKNNGKSIISVANGFSTVLAKIISVLYAFCFIWFAGVGVARFELFLSTVMFSDSELYIMTAILLCAATYASLKGIEALGRASTVLLAIIGTGIIFIIFTVIGEFEFINLKPVLTEGVMPIFGFSFYVCTRTVELITLLVNAPMINGNKTKMTLSWISVFGLMSAVILTVLAGVTGEYGDDQIFPLYTLTVIAKFGIFERLDDILTAIWVLSSFIQIAFLTLSASAALTQGFGNKIKKPYVNIACTAGIGAVYLLLSDTITRFSEIVSTKFHEAGYILLLLLIPISVYLLSIIKKRRNNK